MKYQVGVIAGDGIGPEVVAEAQKVLNCVADKFGHEFEYEDILMGGCSIDATGEPLTDHAIEQALHSDAVLKGSIGGHKHFPMVQTSAGETSGSRLTEIT